MSFKQNQFVGKALSVSLTLFIAVTVFIAGCKSDNPTTPTVQTIMEQIEGNSNFSLLRAAINRAGLGDALRGSGTYTLLAPTNDAFNAFGFTSEALIAVAPVDLVKSVIQYHVLNSKIESSAITSATNTAQPTQFTATAPGNSVYFTRPVAVTTSAGSGTTISVNGAYIVPGQGNSDIQASNGVIHVINRVLLPPMFGNIAQTIVGIPNILPTASFTYLNAAVTRAGLIGSLTAMSGGPITVFAPTDAAFTASVPSLTSVAAVSALPVAQLQQILAYHIVPSNRLYTPLMTNTSSLATGLTGSVLTTGISTTGVTVRGKSNTTTSNITGPDITATNGVIHIIDRLLLP